MQQVASTILCSSNTSRGVGIKHQLCCDNANYGTAVTVSNLIACTVQSQLTPARHASDQCCKVRHLPLWCRCVLPAAAISALLNVSSSYQFHFLLQFAQPVEKAIKTSPLSLNPTSEGAEVLVKLPRMTQDTIEKMVKLVNMEAEHAKQSIRNARQKAMDAIKTAFKSGSADDKKRTEKEVMGFNELLGMSCVLLVLVVQRVHGGLREDLPLMTLPSLSNIVATALWMSCQSNMQAC